MKTKILALGLALCMTGAGAMAATEVEARLQTSALSFSGGRGFTNAVLKVSGPDDFEAEETSSKGLPVFRLQGKRVSNGFYTYTLSAATDEKIMITRSTDNGRGDNARDHLLKPFHLTGMFEIRNNRIVPEAEMADGSSDEAQN